MFRLLSKESNIFSIPVYSGFLFLMIVTFNIFNYSAIEIFSAAVSFSGTVLGYFLFHKIDLTYQTHLPLFLYTFFIFSFYPGHIDLGLSCALLTNAFLLLILTNTDEVVRKQSYLLAGAILAFNYIVLPISWPMAIFVIFHIFGTSERIGLNLFRLFFGFLLVILAYLGIMYFINFTTIDPAYFPFKFSKFRAEPYPYIILFPVVLMLCAALFNHFQHYGEKSPISRYKYTFLLVYSLAQLITVVLYMGKNYEFLLLLALPVSIILSRFLKFLPKYWMQESGLWLVIITLLAFKLGAVFPEVNIFKLK